MPADPKEVDLTLFQGIIECPVPKKDGNMRFCIHVSYLNSVSQFESNPTPRIDDLLECIGRA